MGYIYRYTDLADNIIKYVGIVWSENRSLKKRIKEHEKDDWCKVRRWKIEYITTNINNRTEAEFFESHYISLYQTDKYYNIKKSNWGTSNLIPFTENDWEEYKDDKSVVSNNLISNNQIKILQDKKLRLNTIISKLEEEVNTLKTTLNQYKIIYSENAYSVSANCLIEQINEKINLYDDWADESNTKTKSSREKWANRSSGLRIAKGIIEDTMAKPSKS